MPGAFDGLGDPLLVVGAHAAAAPVHDFSPPGDKPAQVSLEVRMGCGSGLCFSCTIRTKKGLKRVCKDGPVFDFDDIIWDEVVC